MAAAGALGAAPNSQIKQHDHTCRRPRRNTRRSRLCDPIISRLWWSRNCLTILTGRPLAHHVHTNTCQTFFPITLAVLAFLGVLLRSAGFIAQRAMASTLTRLPSPHGDDSNLSVQLMSPPTIRSLLPGVHRDGRERIVPKDYLEPFVYAALAVPARDVETNISQTLLFLYSQGTIVCERDDKGCYNMEVTSCLLGDDQFSVAYDANGVYTCVITRELRIGETLSLVVSGDMWKQKVQDNLASYTAKQFSTLKKLEDGSRVLKSDVSWEGQMDPLVKEGEGRYRICVMTQEKIFPDYIPEWVSYHRKLGVDFVYIYDNQSPKNLSEMFKDADDVEIVHWPWDRSQIQAQNHFMLAGRRRCQWGILIDVDEYVMMRPSRFDKGKEQPLKALLRSMRETTDFSQIRLRSVALGSSGNVYRPRTSIAEAYWHLSNIQDNLTKPIVWLGHAMPDSLVHRVSMSPGYYSYTAFGFHEAKGSSEIIGLCHMKYKSWEDYVQKAQGGRNSFQVGLWSHSSNWSSHKPAKNHLELRNAAPFTEFRGAWRRAIGKKARAPELSGWDEAEKRYARIHKKRWAWKLRRALETGENTTFSRAIIERERAFRRMRRWEVRKMNKFARWNSSVDFFS